MKKINLLLSLILLMSVTMATSWIVWSNFYKDNEFECWARLHTYRSTDTCQKILFSDVFFSFHGNGNGYFLVDGTFSCQNELPKVLTGLINFDYKKQGNYYSIHMKERNAALSEAFTMLTYSSIKLKITRLNSADFIMTLPNETLLVCTED